MTALPTLWTAVGARPCEKRILPGSRAQHWARACRVPCQEQESPTCAPDRPSKILLVQVGTLSSSHPSFGVSVFFLSLGTGVREKNKRFIVPHAGGAAVIGGLFMRVCDCDK